MLAKEAKEVGAESIDYILQCSYEKARTEVRPVNYYVGEQILLDLMYYTGTLVGEIVKRQVFNYFKSDDAAGQVCRKLLSVKLFMAPVSEFIKGRTGQTIAVELVATKWRSRGAHAYQKQL